MNSNAIMFFFYLYRHVAYIINTLKRYSKMLMTTNERKRTPLMIRVFEENGKG